MNPTLIGVIGNDDRDVGEAIPPSALQAAEMVGAAIASHGAILVSGGRGGIMEAASRGAKTKGGLVVGLLPGESKSEANPFVTIPIATGLGRMRNTILVRACDAIVMIGGGVGTLSEAILTYGSKPLVVLEGTGGWSDRMRSIAYDGQFLSEQHSGTRKVGMDLIRYDAARIRFAQTATEAVEMAIAAIDNVD
jgi:uncharacterized protein (TIGR00725 family)